ncbi:hypothetical protein O1611_g6922 [Lasiodiplodia mahajangana]|uniref:Uncharacterized protein n=1 Tax=Lasiodiplodia mahajangana TaxID=1108764 RepID=A0ACC2JH05_9PEZI|nr:hypothetical protein O1611_g6922 [Lasiodiplodia mahajangana]
MARFTTSDGSFVVQSTSMSGVPSVPADRNGDLGYFEHSLGKKGQKILVFKTIMEIDTGAKMDKSKTIGTISTRNGDGILMSAHSGYSSGQNREETACLDTAKWNHLALHHLAQQVRFKFPTNIRDNSGGAIPEEHRGRAHAGHVEVLLACWFVVETVRKTFDFNNKPEEWLITQMKSLKSADLGHRRAAFITIDNEPCRTCLQLLNKVSQYTGILFMVIGSQGIGPVIVRINGQRREDTISDVFSDSDSQHEGREEEGRLQADRAEAPCNVPPATPVQRRPAGSYWRNNTEQWTPEDPEELLSSYKKKTPVYEFPGYDSVPRPPPQLQSIKPQNVPIAGSTPNALVGGIRDSEVTREDSLKDWEDLGGGLMIYFPSATKKQDQDPFKHEHAFLRQPTFSDQRQRYTSPTSQSNGQAYARAAYEAIRESAEHEEIHKANQGDQCPRMLHRHTHYSGRVLPRRVQPALQLREFYHRPVNNASDESVFTSRYAILRPGRHYY